MYLYSNDVTINNKRYLKFGLTMTNKRSCKEVTIKTMYEALNDLE